MSDTAVIYTRISEDREGREVGVAQQLEVCEAYCQRAGLTIVDRLSDNDISASAFSKKERPGYQRVVTLLSSGIAKHVVVRETSRLYRRPRDLENLIDLCEQRGVSVHAPLGGRIDLSSSSGRQIARILSAISAGESDTISERVKYRAAVNARAGKPAGGGYRPFGLTKDWTDHVPGEVAIIREVAGRLIAGDSLRSIAADLHHRGVKTPAAGIKRKARREEDEDGEVGGEWLPSTLKKMLGRPYLLGKREHTTLDHGKRVVLGVYEGQWPAILTQEVWDAVQLVFASNGHGSQVGRTYLLSGLVWCKRCGRPMTGHANGRTRRYVCEQRPDSKGCALSVVADGLDEYVVTYLFDRVDDGLRREATNRQSRPDVKALTAKRAGIEQRRREAADAYASQRLSLASFELADSRLSQESAEIERALREVPSELRAGGIEELRGVWERATLDQRRSLMRQSVRRVLVSPAVTLGRGSKIADRVAVDLCFPFGE